MSVWAQGSPWRYNRYNGFKAHKVTDKTIVFFGNSITNMHEWWEAFNNPNIVNRGVNGADPPSCSSTSRASWWASQNILDDGH